MQNIESIICRKMNIILFLLVEILVVVIYSSVAAVTYSVQELNFGEDDMQLRKHGNAISEGNYLDNSSVDVQAVVTPAFQLRKGIYYIEAVYERQGIVKAGLIYDISRNGNELVNHDEFELNPDKQAISYRVRIRDDSGMRFKLRLTGDAVDGDYIRLLQVRIISSKLTYVYHIFWLVLCMVMADLLVWGYIGYYTKWETERKVVFGTLAITAFFIGLPLYQAGLSNGSDLSFHLSRLEGLYKTLKFTGGNQFPVRIQEGWLDGYGYAVSVFYGDIFMYFPAFLRAVGFTLEEAYKVYLGIVNIATVFLSFYAFKRISRNDLAALAGSVLYAGCAQRVALLYTTVLGAASGMTFYPLIAAGFYLLFTEDIESEEYKRIWILLVAGFSGILMTHMISCLMVGVYSVLLCLIMLRKVMRKKTLCELLKAAGMTALINLWYLVPFLQYLFNERLKINSQLSAEVNIVDYYAGLADFTQEGRSLYNLFTDNDTLGFAMLLVLLLYIVTIPLLGKDKLVKHSRFVALFTLFAFVACTDLFPVVGLAKMSRFVTKFFLTIQYQYRLMSIAVAAASCLAAVFFSMDLFDRKKLYYIIGVLCCITLYQDFQYYATLSNDVTYLDGIALEDRPDQGIYSYKVGNGEYLPAATDTQRFTDEIEGDVQIIDQVERDGISFEVCVNNLSSEKKRLFFPILYYSGYQARDSASYESLETATGDNGRVTVTVPPNYTGTFHLGYHEPLLWRIAEMISVISLMALALIIGNQGHIHNRITERRKVTNGD